MLLDNDTGRQTQSLPQRLVCLSCLALCYACYAHYAADLTAMMTSASAMKVVNSFEQALEEGYTVMVWPNSSDDTYLRTSPPGSARRRCLCIEDYINFWTHNFIIFRAYDLMLENPNKHFFSSMEDFYQRMIADPKNLYFGSFLPWDGDPKLYNNRDMVDRVGTSTAFGYPKDSELKELLDYHLLKLQQSGFFESEWAKWSRGRKPEAGRSPFLEEAKTLGFEELLFPSLVVVAGIAVAVLLLLMEFFALHIQNIMKYAS